MKLSLGLRVANSLSLTPQLQQAIRLLQLSNLELEQEIQNQLDSNPLLEIEEQLDHSTTSQVEEPTQDQFELSDQLNADHLPNELAVDTAWDDVYTHQPTSLGMPELDDREDQQKVNISLQDHMLEQINLLNFSNLDRLIAYCIIDDLNEKGFLESSVSEITDAVRHLLISIDSDDEVEEQEVLTVLKLIQRLEPIGIGSRNLAECLLLQLDALNSDTAYKNEAICLLQHHELLVKNDLAKLLKQTGLSEKTLQHAVLLLKSLKAYPGAEFVNKDLDYQIPDVVLQKKNNRWIVQLNPDVVPKLRVNPYYANMIRRGDQSDDNQYLRNHMLEAKNFIKNIDERHKTLLKVATCIVEHQKEFFEIGAEGMRPLVLREIAEEVELHESTVSRVTTNKYMLTPRGLFELKYFFSSHVGTTTGGEASATAIRAKIKKIIAEENARKPLSDNTIAEILKKEGIDVARRTVAKYREALNIPSSSERKVLI